jgi:hypothetical protein
MSNELLNSFLDHELIQEKHKIQKKDLPNNLKDALKSNKSIINSIAMILQTIQSDSNITDKALKTKVSQHLNENSL